MSNELSIEQAVGILNRNSHDGFTRWRAFTWRELEPNEDMVWADTDDDSGPSLSRASAIIIAAWYQEHEALPPVAPASDGDLEAIKTRWANARLRPSSTSDVRVFDDFNTLLSEVERLRDKCAAQSLRFATGKVSLQSRVASLEAEIDRWKRLAEGQCDLCGKDIDGDAACMCCYYSKRAGGPYDDSQPILAALQLMASDEHATDGQRRVADMAAAEVLRLVAELATLKAGPQEGSWEWALAQMKAGKAVTRQNAGRMCFRGDGLLSHKLHRSYLEATDWQIAAEPASTKGG